MPNQWFRLYAEIVTDPKVQMMTEAMQRRLVMLMGMRCSNNLETLHETEIAFQLRISQEDLVETKALFIDKGFIDETWNLVNWEKRQYNSDTSTERVRAYREKQRKLHETNGTHVKRSSNGLEQNRTDTDTEQNRTEKPTTITSPSTDGEGEEGEFFKDLHPTDEETFEKKDAKLPPEKRAEKKAARAAVRRLFAYYIEHTQRNPKLYTLTLARMDKGLSRLRDCQQKCNGDLGKAEQMMGIAIDAMLASDFHSGKNEQRKEYTDWINHLFKSTEKLEWWLSR